LTWTYEIRDTMRGILLDTVHPTSASWGRVLNDVDAGSYGFQLGELGAGPTGKDRRRGLLRPWARTIVQLDDGVPTAASLISRLTVDRKTRTVTAQTVGIRELLKYRTTFGLAGYDGTSRFEVQNRSLRALAASVVWAGMRGPTANYGLPIALPDMNEAGTQSRTWWDYNSPIVESELTDLQNTDGGPDIDFRPRLDAAGLLEWEMRAGALTAPGLEWNLDSPSAGVASLAVTIDGTKQTTSAYAIGAGSEVDMLVRGQSATPADDVPALVRLGSYKQETDADVLAAHAAADLRALAQPTEQWAVTVETGASTVRPQDFVLGQRIRFYTRNDLYLPDGWSDHRLIGFSGDMTSRVKLDLQPMGA
jgi:hypothetical protein